MKSILVSIMLVFFAVSAQALINVPLMEINSDVDGDDTAYLGIQVANNHSAIENVSYQNYPDKPAKIFTVAGLNKDKETIVKQGPAKIVEISVTSLSRTSMIFNIHYIYEFKLLGSDKRDKKIRISYVAPLNQYQMMDMDTKKIVNRAFFYVNVKNGKQVGISRIETW